MKFKRKERWKFCFWKGKPETPTDILVSDITSSSFKIQFSPSFDGGSGSQEFLIQITDPSNSSIINQKIPFNNYQYIIKDLNESTLYLFRIKSINIYGESLWSHQIPVQTNELIITSEGNWLMCMTIVWFLFWIRFTTITYGIL